MMEENTTSSAYNRLSIQPIQLIKAFRLDFCLASVIKWLTKWHMDSDPIQRRKYLENAEYYVWLCERHDPSTRNALMFATTAYCMVNGFAQTDGGKYLLASVVDLVTKGDLEGAATLLASQEMHRLAENSIN